MTLDEQQLQRLHQQVVADAATLRGLIREAHETTQDLLNLIREAHKTNNEIAKTAVGTTQAMIDQSVKLGLERYHEAIKTQIDTATKVVQHRFDVLASILLGTKKNRHLENLVEDFVNQAGPFTRKQVAPFMEGRPTQGDTDD